MTERAPEIQPDPAAEETRHEDGALSVTLVGTYEGLDVWRAVCTEHDHYAHFTAPAEVHGSHLRACMLAVLGVEPEAAPSSRRARRHGRRQR